MGGFLLYAAALPGRRRPRARSGGADGGVPQASVRSADGAFPPHLERRDRALRQGRLLGRRKRLGCRGHGQAAAPHPGGGEGSAPPSAEAGASAAAGAARRGAGGRVVARHSQPSRFLRGGQLFPDVRLCAVYRHGGRLAKGEGIQASGGKAARRTGSWTATALCGTSAACRTFPPRASLRRARRFI